MQIQIVYLGNMYLSICNGTKRLIDGTFQRYSHVFLREARPEIQHWNDHVSGSLTL